MALEITDSNYKEILAEGKPVVVDFWWLLLLKNWLRSLKDKSSSVNAMWMITAMWLPNTVSATFLLFCSSRMVRL